MKELNKKNLKEINNRINEYAAMNTMYDSYKNEPYNSEDSLFGSRCFYRSVMVAINTYKEFGIALMNEQYLLEDILPNENEYIEKFERANQNWLDARKKEIA